MESQLPPPTSLRPRRPPKIIQILEESGVLYGLGDDGVTYAAQTEDKLPRWEGFIDALEIPGGEGWERE